MRAIISIVSIILLIAIATGAEPITGIQVSINPDVIDALAGNLPPPVVGGSSWQQSEPPPVVGGSSWQQSEPPPVVGGGSWQQSTPAPSDQVQPPTQGDETAPTETESDQSVGDHLFDDNWRVIVTEEPKSFMTYPNYPSATYLGTSQKSGNNNLWIETSQGRTQYAAVLPYSSVYLIASTPIGGQGEVYELYPSTTGQGIFYTKTYRFNPGDNRLEFSAEVPGKHILLFLINNQISNGVGIDVKGSVNSLDQQGDAGILGKAMPDAMA